MVTNAELGACDCGRTLHHDGPHRTQDEIDRFQQQEDRRRQSRERDWTARRVWARYRHACLPDTPSTAVEAAVLNWAENGFGSNLILRGPVGTGKTWLACAATRRMYVEDEATVAVTTAAEMLTRLHPGGDATPGTFIKPDYLLLDDIGPEKPTEWALEQLQAVIDGRSKQERATIVTTNMSSAEFEATYGARIADRLREDAVIVNVGGKSRRKVASAPSALHSVADHRTNDQAVSQ